jgi:hypothetical protein
MEAFGGIVVIVLLACAAWSLAMRAMGKGDVPDRVGREMISSFFKRFIK